MSASCDYYGFPLTGLSSAEMACRAQSHAKQAAAEHMWVRLLPAALDPAEAIAQLPDRTMACSPKLKAAIREGVPPLLRPLLWKRLARADELRSAHEGTYYASCCKAAGVHGLLLTQLEADLSFVSPPHSMLYSRRVLEAVRRIVMAYGHRNADVGYNPLLGGLCVFLLAVMGVDAEVDVFWLLAGLVEHVLPVGYYEVCGCFLGKGILYGGGSVFCSAVFHGSPLTNSPSPSQSNRGCNMEMRVLTTLLSKKAPRVAAQLERLEVDPLHVVDPWCASLFTRTLPAETCVRVWDWLFAEGPKALLRVGLALFRMNESALLSVVHGFQLTRTLSWRVGRCYQVDVLAKVR